MQPLVMVPAQRHQVVVRFAGLPPAHLVLAHAPVRDVVQVQGPGPGQRDPADLAGRLLAGLPAVREPPHPPVPPCLGLQVPLVLG